jgi:SAM-dependent methyltransferase
MSDAETSRQMREDWDRRARDDARYYVAFGRRRQAAAEFFASAEEALHAIRFELRRFPPAVDPRTLSALEIGCGPGRLLVPLSRVLGRIVGVDVSPEMVAQARQNLEGIDNASVETTSGADLAAFQDESFDFCYSYAVFQHIPDKAAVWSYLREAWRVLRPGGILKCQFNGLLEEPSRAADTWSGARFRPEELREFCRAQDFQLLLLEGADTQNLWMAAAKRPAGWGRTLRAVAGARLLRITNAYTTDRVVPAAGRFSSASLWVDDLTSDADLNNLEVEIGGRRAAPCYVGRYSWNGPSQVNVFLPAGTPTGVVPARLWMLGEPISNYAPLRVIPPPPAAPRLLSVTDGINLLAGTQIETGTLKVNLEEVGPAPALTAALDGEELADLEAFCVDPLPERYTLNLKVPEGTAPGHHWLTVRLRGRAFAPVAIDIVA